MESTADYRGFYKPVKKPFYGDGRNRKAHEEAVGIAKAEGERIWSIIGWRQFYNIAIREGWYTDFKDCFYSDWEDLVDRLSVKFIIE